MNKFTKYNLLRKEKNEKNYIPKLLFYEGLLCSQILIIFIQLKWKKHFFKY